LESSTLIELSSDTIERENYLMLTRKKFAHIVACAAFAIAPCLAQGQVIFSDGNFDPADYTVSGAGNQDARLGLDYSSFDYFGDGFLLVNIPPSPRGGGSTTGVLLSANADTTLPAVQSFTSVIPNGVNVGAGTANPNYVLRVDVFNSTGAGIDDGAGNISRAGTTTQAFVGLNQANTTVQVGTLNAPGATGSLSGQGLALSITGDTGAAEDYMPIYGGAIYRDRPPGPVVDGQQYFGTPTGDHGRSGLAGQVLNEFWLTQGFELGGTDPDNNLIVFTGDDQFRTPDPADPGAWFGGDLTVPGVQVRQYYAEQFKVSTEPLHYDQPSLAPPAFLAPNGVSIPDGVLQNQWVTHELYWVDGTFTYVKGGVPVLQITPELGDNIFSPFSENGAPVLGFWDRFGGSIATSPEGANFAVFDNLEIAVADSSDVPSMIAHMEALGFLPAAPVGDGDFDGDGIVDGHDFLMWQRDTSIGNLADWEANFGSGAPLASAVAIPEPTSVVLLLGLASMGLLRGRRFAC
jgi:hypothetical protein